MAAKIIANLIVMGSGILARAFVQAYRQALAILGMRNQPEEELIRTVSLLNAYICPDSAVAWEIIDASKTGVAQETIQNTVRRASKTMTEQEARQILGVSESSSWEEILQKYENLFESNAKSGSFYLQSKVHRAKECLETFQQQKAQGTG